MKMYVSTVIHDHVIWDPESKTAQLYSAIMTFIMYTSVIIRAYQK